MKKLKNYFLILLKDFREAIFPLFFAISLLRSRFLWTSLEHFYCFLKKIKVGKNILFYGRTYFFREPYSSISIGNNCIFNSNKKYNLLGINKKCMISTLMPKAQIIIGDKCVFSGVNITAHKSVVLGKNIKCGANVTITDSDWHPEDYRSQNHKEIVIEDNVWLGLNVVVLKGVTIGENSLIGANSLVTKSIPANVIAAGNPCVVIKSIDQNNAL